MKLMSVKKKQERKLEIPAIERLRDHSLVSEYNIALRNKFDCLEPEVDLESMWDNFKTSVAQVSMEILGQRPRKKKDRHQSQKTKDLLKNRKEFKRKDPNSNANRSEYSRMNKLFKKSSKVDDNNWALRMADD